MNVWWILMHSKRRVHEWVRCQMAWKPSKLIWAIKWALSLWLVISSQMSLCEKLFNNDFSICMSFIDIDVRKLSFFCSLNFHVYASVDQYCVAKWILFLIFMNMRNLMRLNKETECRWWDEEKWNSIYLVVCHSWKKDRRSV